MQPFNTTRKKPPARVTIPSDEKLLVSRGEAAQLLSISQRGLDYLMPIASCPRGELAEECWFPWLTCVGTRAAIIPNGLSPRALSRA